jgi:peroxiredoxin Q/BCP
MTSKEFKVGDPAPDFVLPASDGTQVGLKDFLGKKTVILYFYPKDDTPGCTKEACSFRDSLQVLLKEGAVVLGVSRDSLESHLKFINKYTLPFLLLSDEDTEVCKAYGVYKLKNMYGKTSWGIQRTTFVIDKKGKIAKIYDKVSVETHAQDILTYLQSGT